MDKMRLLESALYRADLKKAVEKCDIEPLRNKTIFITGGLGLICSAVVDLLIMANIEASADIRIVVGARNKEKFNLRYGNEDVTFCQYDALEKPACDFVPDYIIHGASVASPELYTKKPVETLLSNFTGSKNLLDFSMANGVGRILYISSSEVYGTKETEEPFCEGKYGIVDIDSIRSSYPIAKRASEMLCRSYSSEYGLNTVIVRPGHVYGPTASLTDRRISSVFPYEAARGRDLEMKSAGTQRRSYCYAVDAAVAILIALTRGENGEAYNIGHDQIITIRQMAEIIARAGKVALTVAEPNESERNAFNPMNNAALNNNKIKALGYRDIFTAEEGLEHTVKIIKEIL